MRKLCWASLIWTRRLNLPLEQDDPLPREKTSWLVINSAQVIWFGLGQEQDSLPIANPN